MDLNNCILSSSKQNDMIKHKTNVKDYFQTRENENSSHLNKMICKTTQVNLDSYISVDDLSKSLPTENYWKVIAEKRRIALEDALTENERLWKLHEELVTENAEHKKLLEEANSFIEVFKELSEDIANDTGVELDDSTDS